MNPIPPQFAQVLKAFREVQAELGQAQAPDATVLPTLPDALARIGPIPPYSLLFGVATDGLPLLLDLRNPAPGPILVAGDRGSGKTSFLLGLIQAAIHLNPPETVRFAVLTDFPDEWANIPISSHFMGVWPAYAPSTPDMLFDLATWVDAGGDEQSTILLWDGLDAILHMDENTQDVFRYLLLHGSKARLWPIVTVNSFRGMKMPEWTEFFRTRIYGRIVDPEVAEDLTPIPGAGLHNLFAGAQFCLRENSRWLRFWLPQP